MVLSSPFSSIGLWDIRRTFLLCFLLFPSFADAQQLPFSATKWRVLAQRIDQDTAQTIVHLKNEQFLEDTLATVGELMGYFYHGKLRKMHCVIRYTFRIDEKTFYFDQDQVALVRHTSRSFTFDETTGEYRHDSLEAPFNGHYFFEGGKLLHYDVTEDGHHFESEEQDIEYTVRQESKLWIQALRRTAAN